MLYPSIDFEWTWYMYIPLKNLIRNQKCDAEDADGKMISMCLPCFAGDTKSIEYDQEIHKNHTLHSNQRHREGEPKNTNSQKTVKIRQPALSAPSIRLKTRKDTK